MDNYKKITAQTRLTPLYIEIIEVAKSEEKIFRSPPVKNKKLQNLADEILNKNYKKSSNFNEQNFSSCEMTDESVRIDYNFGVDPAFSQNGLPSSTPKPTQPFKIPIHRPRKLQKKTDL